MVQIQTIPRVLHICQEIMVSSFFQYTIDTHCTFRWKRALLLCSIWYYIDIDSGELQQKLSFGYRYQDLFFINQIQTYWHCQSGKMMRLCNFKSQEDARTKLFEHLGKQNASKLIKQEHQHGRIGLIVISLATKIMNLSLVKEKGHDIASRFEITVWRALFLVKLSIWC